MSFTSDKGGRKAGPRPGSDTPYYYPGGMVGGRPVPSGWYSQPLWKTALAAGAGAVGSMLPFDALFSPSWGDPGYDTGFDQGHEYADEHGWTPAATRVGAMTATVAATSSVISVAGISDRGSAERALDE